MLSKPVSIAQNLLSHIGSLIWVRNDDRFTKFRLVSILTELKRLEIQDLRAPHKKFYVEEKNCYLIDPAFEQTQLNNNSLIQELPSLSILNQPNILESLSVLYSNSMIYSRMGDVLISLNPFQDMQDLYSNAIHQRYSKTKLLLKCPPHPFSVAQKAFRSLRTHSGDSSEKVQSIIVTGISGSGKTENTKLIINYLSLRSESAQSKLNELLLLVNPVLEAFGNAQSANNGNSSRFGKLIKIYYKQEMGKMKISGAKVQTSLLQGFRVTSLNSEEERNFHIFYQLASENYQLQNLKYIKNCHFSMTQISELISDFNNLKKTMKKIGFNSKFQEQIFDVVKGISWLGEIEFIDSTLLTEDADDKENIEINMIQQNKSNCGVEEDSASIKNTTPVQKAANLLKLSSKDLKSYLLQREISIGKKNVQIIKRKRHMMGSMAARDALAKFLYLKLFKSIVDQINRSLKTNCSDQKTEEQNELLCIQILDIYGFEDLKTNSLEQLCINYTNEQLHDFSLQSTIGAKLQLFKDQGVNKSLANCNIAKKQNAIKDLCKLMDLVDDQNKLNKIQNNSIIDLSNILTTTLRSRYLSQKKQEHIQASHKHHKLRNSLVIDHYAGTTCYQTSQWVMKNAFLDYNSSGLIKLLITSEVDLIKQMLHVDQNQDENEREEKMCNGKKRLFHTFTMEFRAQFSRLIEALQSSHHYFIFCIKPNMEKEPKILDSKLILQQLNATGLISLAQIYGSSQSNFPVQIQISSFFASNDYLLKILPERWTKLKSNLQCITLLLGVFGFVQFEHYVMGTTLIFMRSENALFIEKVRSCEYQFELKSELIQGIEAKTKRALLRKVFRGSRVCSIIWKSIKIKRSIALWSQFAEKLFIQKKKDYKRKILQQMESLRKMQLLDMRLRLRSYFMRIKEQVHQVKMIEAKFDVLQNLLSIKKKQRRFNKMRDFNNQVFQRARAMLGVEMFNKKFDNPCVITEQFLDSLHTAWEVVQSSQDQNQSAIFFDRESSCVYIDNEFYLQNVADISFNPMNQNLLVASRGNQIEVLRFSEGKLKKLIWISDQVNCLQNGNVLVNGFAFKLNWISEVVFEIVFIPSKESKDAKSLQTVKFNLIMWKFV